MTNEEKLKSELRTYVFHRKTHWYPVEIPCETLMDNITHNPGTTKVTDLDGEVLWSLPND